MTMKFFLTVSVLISAVAGFLSEPPTFRFSRCLLAIEMGYVPDGMSPEQYRALKSKEKESAKKKKFGAFGPQSFQSRSMLSFQKDLEAGKANHLMPVFNAKEKLKKGTLKESDIPYMQRLGSWDNSDLGKKQKKLWRKEDQGYNQNQNPGGVDWSGNNQRRGPAQTSKNGVPAPPKKKGGLFGIF